MSELVITELLGKLLPPWVNLSRPTPPSPASLPLVQAISLAISRVASSPTEAKSGLSDYLMSRLQDVGFEALGPDWANGTWEELRRAVRSASNPNIAEKFGLLKEAMTLEALTEEELAELEPLRRQREAEMRSETVVVFHGTSAFARDLIAEGGLQEGSRSFGGPCATSIESYAHFYAWKRTAWSMILDNATNVGLIVRCEVAGKRLGPDFDMPSCPSYRVEGGVSPDELTFGPPIPFGDLTDRARAYEVAFGRSLTPLAISTLDSLIGEADAFGACVPSRARGWFYTHPRRET